MEPPPVTRLPIKHVVRDELPLEQYITMMLDQALSEERLRLALKKQWRRGEWDKTRLQADLKALREKKERLSRKEMLRERRLSFSPGMVIFPSFARLPLFFELSTSSVHFVKAELIFKNDELKLLLVMSLFCKLAHLY